MDPLETFSTIYTLTRAAMRARQNGRIGDALRLEDARDTIFERFERGTCARCQAESVATFAEEEATLREALEPFYPECPAEPMTATGPCPCERK